MRPVHLAIDAADDEPGVAIADEDGRVVASRTWRTERNHSVELLPAVERLLSEAGAGRGDITAVFVDVGPGGYAALRVGVSIAKGIAHGLGVPIAGIGRLELDAARVDAPGRSVVAVHRAGRGELAVARYAVGPTGELSEEDAPHVIKAVELSSAVRPGDVVTGDVDDDAIRIVADAGGEILRGDAHRVFALARLGARRLAAGRTDDALMLVPLYLRAPAIGPQG
jgi:tRNA threonylcarbamoyladenosine biosynthesis protein TsaB